MSYSYSCSINDGINLIRLRYSSLALTPPYHDFFCKGRRNTQHKNPPKTFGVANHNRLLTERVIFSRRTTVSIVEGLKLSCATAVCPRLRLAIPKMFWRIVVLCGAVSFEKKNHGTTKILISTCSTVVATNI